MQSVKITPMRCFAVLAVAVYVLILTLPTPSPAVLGAYHLTNTSYRILLYSLLVAETVIWYSSFFAFAKLLEYSGYLKGAKEGKAFKIISIGMGVLAFGLVITAIISAIFSHISASHAGFAKAATITNNYLTLLVPIIAFTLIGSGAYFLASTTRSKMNLNTTRVFILAFITLGVFFEHVTIHANNTGRNPYYLSLYLLIITIIIPYLYAWFVAIVSAYHFQVYSYKVRGLLYKRALSLLAAGIAVTTLGYIAIQFIIGIYGYRASLSPGLIFALLYVWLAIFASGLGLIAFGAKKLKKIEEV